MNLIHMATTENKKSRGRPSSFKREEMIETVMNLFWEKGYKALSFNEIAKETGLTRASLYNAFATKESLLLETIQHYSKSSPDNVLDNVKEGESVGGVFYTLFDRASQSRANDTKHRGCLIVNCVSELIASDTELGKRILSLYQAREKLIQQLLEQAVKQKELPKDSNPEILASLILTFMSGFNTFSKNGAGEEKLRAMSHTFLRQLGLNQQADNP